MCHRPIDDELNWHKFLGGYDAVLSQMRPGGGLFDRERINRYNRLALAEDQDECEPDDEF
jgi:hypothetical protein